MTTRSIELGCGLIGIGRPWGVQETPVPSESQALTFLDTALLHSIHYFDTAPSYGLSEERLGKWLQSLSSEQRNQLTIATKFGEHWSTDKQQSYVDHSFDALRQSIDQSLDRLGRIDILQLHKTSPEVLQSEDLHKAWDYARLQGILRLGVSVSDTVSGEMACEDDQYELIQLPFNQSNTTLAPVILKAINAGKLIATNRPFNMGETVSNSSVKANRSTLEEQAFAFILQQGFTGFVLTGTKSPEHLIENIEAFTKAYDLSA
ncbi:MAG: aldo/keto reductase [Candidatus Woesebacteria bacterium]